MACKLFDSLQTAHTTIADVAGTLATLDRTLDRNQFQFLLKHSVHPLVQLQVPACLCHPGELKFAKQHLTDDELYEQHGVNTVLPRPHHPDSSQVLQGENMKQAKNRPKQRKLKWQEQQTKKNHTRTGRIPTACNYRSRPRNATTRGHQTKEEIQV